MKKIKLPKVSKKETRDPDKVRFARWKKMSKKKRVLITLLAVAVLAGAGYYAHSRAAAADNVASYSTSTLERTDVLHEVKTSGKIESTLSQNITASGEGKIMKVYAKEGDKVTKGEALAQLDTSAVDKQIADANRAHSQEVKAARSAMDTAQSDYDAAKMNYKVGDISRLDLNKARTALIAARSDYREKTSDNSSVSTLENQRDACTIRATASGTVTSANATVGATTSGSLFTIENPKSLKISVKVNEYDVNSVKPGQTAIVKTEMTGSREFRGKVTHVSTTAVKSDDGKTETSGKAQFAVAIRILNPTEKVRIGGNARASIVLGGRRNVLAVTVDSITTDDNGDKVVFTYTGSGDNIRAKAIKVETGVTNDIYQAVTGDGLKEGMEIINNADGLTDGQKITLES
jgi:RND family efflux transporter, MFP subunit